MVNVTGRGSQVATALPSGTSASLARHAAWQVGSRTWTPAGRSPGVAVASSGIALATTAAIGRGGPSPGSDLFEKVLVVPRRIDAGFILSDQVWAVGVWNTFRRMSQGLQSVAVSGTGGATLGGPGAMTFFPGQYQAYSLTLLAAGPTTVANQVAWTFPGVDGTTLEVTGSRLTVFAFRPDWSETYRESPAWFTEVLPAYDGTEQRRALRTIPRRKLAFRVLTTEPQETIALEALAYGWQERRFGVPVWPETSLLQADLALGGTAVAVDMAYRPSFEAGGMVMLWSSWSTWEAFTVAAVAPGLLTLGSEATKAWTAGARVVPLRLARFQSDQPLGRPANWITGADFLFECEAP